MRMSTLPVPVVGSFGFYGPNPGGPRSPNIVRAVRDSIVEVREIVTGVIAELTLTEFWSVRQMCADTDRIIEDNSFDKVELSDRIRAMNVALDCYNKYGSKPAAKLLVSDPTGVPELPELLEAQELTATAPSLALLDLPGFSSVSAMDLVVRVPEVQAPKLSLEALESADDTFLTLPDLDASPTTPLDRPDAPPKADSEEGPLEAVLDHMDVALPDLQGKVRQAVPA